MKGMSFKIFKLYSPLFECTINLSTILKIVSEFFLYVSFIFVSTTKAFLVVETQVFITDLNNYVKIRKR
jgi:hypothetical protein